MIILIDNGHGRETPGKSSTDKKLREWKYTREIAEEVVAILKSMGYNAQRIVTEDNDVSLGERARRINRFCTQYGATEVLMVSIHCNAAGDGSKWMNGQGWEAYTTPGKTKSDILAECLYKRAEKNFNGRKIRKDTSDGDSDKEANFYVLKYSRCAAVLTENFFMDNKSDCEYMLSEAGRHAIVRTHVEGIIDYIQSKEGKK